MPMPYENFNWRPNDNSARTNLRYTLEAEKWVSAVSSAQRKAQPRSISGDLTFISMVIQLVLCVVLLIVLGILQLIKATVKFIETNVENNRTNKGWEEKEEKNKKGLIGESKEPDKVWTINKEEQYPTGWQLIFWTRWGRLRYFWQFLYLLVFIFIVEMVVLGLLSLWIPEYVSMNKEVMIFAAGVSLWNACMGVRDY